MLGALPCRLASRSMLVRRGARGGQDGRPETTEDRRRVRPGGRGTRWDL